VLPMLVTVRASRAASSMNGQPVDACGMAGGCRGAWSADPTARQEGRAVDGDRLAGPLGLQLFGRCQVLPSDLQTLPSVPPATKTSHLHKKGHPHRAVPNDPSDDGTSEDPSDDDSPSDPIGHDDSDVPIFSLETETAPYLFAPEFAPVTWSHLFPTVVRAPARLRC
jgi:hypothetical protein